MNRLVFTHRMQTVPYDVNGQDCTEGIYYIVFDQDTVETCLSLASAFIVAGTYGFGGSVSIQWRIGNVSFCLVKHYRDMFQCFWANIGPCAMVDGGDSEGSTTSTIDRGYRDASTHWIHMNREMLAQGGSFDTFPGFYQRSDMVEVGR